MNTQKSKFSCKTSLKAAVRIWCLFHQLSASFIHNIMSNVMSIESGHEKCTRTYRLWRGFRNCCTSLYAIIMKHNIQNQQFDSSATYIRHNVTYLSIAESDGFDNEIHYYYFLL